MTTTDESAAGDPETLVRLSEEAIEPYRGKLLYADHQLIKAKNFGAVAANFRRRRYVSLLIAIPISLYFLLVGKWFWALFAATGAAHEYILARRTHETILGWQQGAHGEVREPPKNSEQ